MKALESRLTRVEATIEEFVKMRLEALSELSPRLTELEFALADVRGALRGLKQRELVGAPSDRTRATARQ